ncbi:MAG TPA: DUF2568 domain-containing protein [Microbacteriaceae bacterium]|nr:DUF2568 domain-containing protein [Microbacteriaceae bacterium]
MTETVPPKNNPAVIGAIRSVWHLIAVAVVTAWGFITWALPFPGLFFGVGALVLAVLLWALFLSPKPVLRADRFAQSMIELLLLASAVAAMIELNVPWVIAALFGVIGAVLGYIVGLPKPQNNV